MINLLLFGLGIINNSLLYKNPVARNHNLAPAGCNYPIPEILLHHANTPEIPPNSHGGRHVPEIIPRTD